MDREAPFSIPTKRRLLRSMGAVQKQNGRLTAIL